jgi:dihydroorotate dehydrogenase (NAD+) catalytic subunit
MAKLNVQLKDIELASPVMAASGTFGYGPEYEGLVDFSKLGGIFVKGTTGQPRQGNPYPRMAETAMGMLNAVGLQNPGVDAFVKDIYPTIKDMPTRLFVNVSGSTVDEYVDVARKINPLDKIPGIELNISCPNVKEGGMAFGTSCPAAREVISAVRKAYGKLLIVKLSPNVTDIAEMARVAEDSGADALSLINTLLGMAIDHRTRRPKLSTITGGLSGPAIKPVALRMVWQVSQAVNVPIIGLGGIQSAADAIEFMLAGATALQVGTANFVEPRACDMITGGIRQYCEQEGIKSVTELTGAMEV